MKKARERLAALVDPALARLAAVVDDDDSRVALAAAKDILDRNDLTGKTKHEITGPEGEPAVSRIEIDWCGVGTSET